MKGRCSRNYRFLQQQCLFVLSLLSAFQMFQVPDGNTASHHVAAFQSTKSLHRFHRNNDFSFMVPPYYDSTLSMSSTTRRRHHSLRVLFAESSSSSAALDDHSDDGDNNTSSSSSSSSSSKSSSGEEEEEEEVMWDVGDVYEDLDRLEAAIILSNAEENLKHSERIETLQHLAAQRRRIYPDFQKFILTPLGGALVGVCLWNYPTTRPIARWITRLFDYHFWSIVVAAPLLLLVAKRRSLPPPTPLPDELKQLDPTLLPSINMELYWEDPKTSCRDYVLFLLEYWTSSVFGMAVVGCLTRMIKTFPTKDPLVVLWISVAQCLTRVGALLSLHQYSNQLFQLERNQQPRPVAWFPAILQQLVRNLHEWAPLGIASDLSKVLVCLKRDSLIALYATIAVFIISRYYRFAYTQKKSNPDDDTQDNMEINSSSLVQKTVYALAAAAFWKTPLSNLRHTLGNFPWKRLAYHFQRVPLMVGATCTGIIVLGLTPIVSPLVHIWKIRKIIQVGYTHDLSLDMDPEAYQASLADTASMSQRMAWRYRINWREPKRLGQIIREWKKNVEYWWLVKGTVFEKLERQKINHYRQRAGRGNLIWDRMADEIARDPNQGQVLPDMDQQKAEAMEQMAAKHKFDYDRKIYDDPLGVAVQQVFGIGLGFNFEHTKPPKNPQDKPSLRRLQARAAKSAIRRVQNLYDGLGAELDGISNSKQRKKRSKELQVEIDKEVKHLAKRLTDLVPTESSGDFNNDVQMFQQDYIKTGPNEYLLRQPFRRSGSDVVTELLKNMGIDKKSYETIEIEDDSNGKDDEFIEAYLDQKDDDNDEGNMMLA